MKNNMTKNAARAGKETKSKSKASEAERADGANGASASARPFVLLAPRAAEAISVADPLNEQGELVCTSETSAHARSRCLSSIVGCS